jgi:hypothetical protein
VWYGGSDTLATVGPSVVSGPPKSTAQGEEKHGRESLALAGKKKEKMNGVQKKRYRALFEYTSRLVFE